LYFSGNGVIKGVDKNRGFIVNGCFIILEGLKTLLQITGEFKLIKPVVTPYQ
jgi:hypothetical protein